MTQSTSNVETVRQDLHSRFDGALKRAFDVSAALCGLIILAPVFAFIAFLVKRQSEGPVFYRGERLGRHGVPFRILKFRTMFENGAKDSGPRITAGDDPRITQVGRWLRTTKLNELPQLWNVLVGDMSLVGPRPEDPEVARAWPSDLLEQILSVRPGITSPASVIYRDEEQSLRTATVMDEYLKHLVPDKVRLDQIYVRNHTFASDLDVLFYTLATLRPGVSRAAISAEEVFNGFLYRSVRRYFSWFIVDTLVAFVAVGTSGILWRLNGRLELGIGPAILVAVSMALTFSVVNTALGLDRVWWRYAKAFYAFDLALSGAVGTIAIALASRLLFTRRELVPPGMVLVAGLLAFLGFVAVRYRERLLTGLGTWWVWRRGQGSTPGEKVLIVGAGECGLLAAWLLRRSQVSAAFSVVGMVDDDPLKQGLVLEGYRILGLTRRIPELVERYHVGLLLFAIEKIVPEDQARILEVCARTPARLVQIPDLTAAFRERLAQRPPGDLADRTIA